MAFSLVKYILKYGFSSISGNSVVSTKQWLLLFAILCFQQCCISKGLRLPMLKMKGRRIIRSVVDPRELVKRLQLQSMLSALGTNDVNIYSSRKANPIHEKRESENSNEIENSDAVSLIKDKENTISKLSWDIIRRNVPARKPANNNLVHKRGAPCRKRRSIERDEREKRHLKTPPGQGIVPAYDMYSEQCEDDQPVEIVKIKKLIVEDGVIRDNDIIEQSMLA